LFLKNLLSLKSKKIVEQQVIDEDSEEEEIQNEIASIKEKIKFLSNCIECKLHISKQNDKCIRCYKDYKSSLSKRSNSNNWKIWNSRAGK